MTARTSTKNVTSGHHHLISDQESRPSRPKPADATAADLNAGNATRNRSERLGIDRCAT
jgi:hypothetical protein